MIYSCFDARSGLYRYFEDSASQPVNSDLPVPSFPRATKIGVPAIEAARALPAEARPAGSGWHARGIIVQCGIPTGASSFGSLSLSSQSMLFGAALLAVGGYLLWIDQAVSGVVVGAVGGAILMG